MTGSELTLIIQTTLPLVFGTILAWLAYRYAIKQKKYSSKQDYYKKIRKANANLLVLWKELHQIKMLLKDKSKENQILIESNLAPKFLELEKEKINYLEKAFNSSTEVIQELDSVLYVEIEDVFERFNKLIDELFYPIVFDVRIDYDRRVEISLPLIEELEQALLTSIDDLTINLPKSERKKIHGFIDAIQDESQEQRVKVPKFLVKLFNKKFRPLEEFQQDEIITFFSNDTIKWAVSKVIETGLYRKLFDGELVNSIKLIALNEEEQEKWIREKLSDNDISVFLNKIIITEEEEAYYFRNNMTFYKILLEFVRKMGSKLSIGEKRVLIMTNNGQLSIRNELDKLKKQVNGD